MIFVHIIHIIHIDNHLLLACFSFIIHYAIMNTNKREQGG